MGAGIALAIKNRWPKAYDADVMFPLSKQERLGKFSYYETGGIANKTIVNLYTQLDYGRNKVQFNYEAFKDGLELMAKFLKEGSTVAMPRIGAGLAGGDWQRIQAIIEQSSLNKFPITIYSL